jgi:hypothetical protein
MSKRLRKLSKVNLDPVLTSDDNLKELLESIETDYDDNLKELSENTEDTLKLLEEIDPSFLKPSKEIKTIKPLPTNKNWYI